MKYIFTALLCAISFFTLSQNSFPVYQSNQSLNFSAFRSGVNFAYVAFDEEKTRFLLENQENPQHAALQGILKYLRENGFENVQWGSISNSPKDVASLCEVVIVRPYWKFNGDSFSDFSISYYSCRNDVYTFTADKPVQFFAHTDVAAVFFKKMQLMYGYKKSRFDLDYSLMLDTEMTQHREKDIMADIREKGAGQFEGIYECISPNAMGRKMKLAALRDKDKMQLIYLDGAVNHLDWHEGEVKASLQPTATSSLFKCAWKEVDKTVNDNPYVTFESGIMNVIMSSNEKIVFVKIFPSASDIIRTRQSNAQTGTGFAISNDGLLITNYHVIKGGSEIRVRGFGGNISQSYTATIVLEDKNNDLAVLKIDDPDFELPGSIPYSLSNRTGDVGTSVFVLGYPLPSSMGTELKLTNGLISSRSGYQGDVTSYQISAPVQPGNSGGPVFDNEGNVVGIVNARHTGADQASYAVKSNYLNSLMEMLPQRNMSSSLSMMHGLSLTEQVRRYRDFICLVEVQ